MKRWAMNGLAWGMALCALLAWGCATQQPHPATVSGIVNQDVAGLSADDIVQVMSRSGFTDEQILEMGTDLRNQLATSGAAKIVADGKVDAIFAVDGPRLHVTSRFRGGFLYDLPTAATRPAGEQ